MSGTLQSFLATGTTKAVADLQTALGSLPADKRNWKPSDTSRSALAQIAECAILNGIIAQCATLNGVATNEIPARMWPQDFDYQQYRSDVAALAKDEGRVVSLLQENTAKVIEQLHNIPDDELSTEITTPWGMQTLDEIVAYPFWNMTYHMGQINYIASLPGCLH